MPTREEISTRKPTKVSRWKLAVGLILVLVEVENWLTPERNIPDALKASNETQQGAIYLVSVLIGLVGIGFVVAGLRGLWLKRS
jgi:hypothetical protein